MTEPTSRRRFAILPLVMLAVTLPNVLRNWDGLKSDWPFWWPVFAHLLLVLAGGIVVAAVTYGVVAWRSART